MKALRSYFLNKILKKHRSQLAYAGWQSVKRIAVLVDEDPENPSLYKSRLKHLHALGPEVVHVVHSPTKKPKEGAAPNTYYKGDVLYIGKPKKAVFNQLKDAQVLVDWTTKPSSPNDFLAAQCSAGFKIGVHRTLPCFDFIIKGKNNNAQDIVKEIENYLKLINNND